MAATRIAVRVHVFKSEGSLRQYAFRHKNDRCDIVDILAYDGRAYKFIDDTGLHTIPASIGRLMAKQMHLNKYKDSSISGGNTFQARLFAEEPNQLVAEYTFEG